ncbi:alcohol acyltransferase 9 [Ricinus communis]|uniref:Taxadien-5-alpha-ol O-acetyltransferase, putative n=1 Tax=Ricinus communis TaxID=3988 RepID=B9R7Y9_RICCO|nr:alcohol acyltransferase 9 [Ricinus communis]EEF52619.1 Taxadien-5-alpha-ol O-acetyltransferase, putative [Ricinus communis]|eukprot:XP_002510432.1 fatty alcohol:caffeoyl-CoA acyltransferase [Ricinus communis]
MFKSSSSSSSQELPNCFYQNQPVLVSPLTPTPKHSLYLSNLDDQRFLRFSIKYLYLFKKSVNLDILKYSLSKVLVDYYPLAGRLKTSSEGDHKLEVDCNGEGSVFAEAFLDITAEQFLELSKKPNRSWRKLLYRVEAQSFLDIPPLVVQVTNLRCGGMILCTGINHCLCDGIGTSQFLQAWAHVTAKPNLDLPIVPFHARHVLKPRNPPQITFTHPGYVRNTPNKDNDPTGLSLNHYLQSQPLVPTSLTFTTSHILRLKRQCFPSLKCTTFETLASHTWRSWVRALDLSPSLNVKLLFSVNVRKKLIPEMPQGYYGNGFVLGCAQTMVKDLTTSNLHHGVKLVQHAKSSLSDDYIRSMIDLLEDKTVKTDLSASLVISQWSKLGLEDLEFGEGKPLHMGPLSSDIYCLFLPAIGDVNAVTVLVSVPESVAAKFEYHMMEDLWDKETKDANGNGFC